MTCGRYPAGWPHFLSGFRYFREKIHSTQMCMLLKPVFSRHEGDWVQITDEPTGNLDEDTAGDITEILKESAHQMKKCVVVVTHSNELAKQADVVFRLKKGELSIDQSGKSS